MKIYITYNVKENAFLHYNVIEYFSHVCTPRRSIHPREVQRFAGLISLYDSK